MSSKLPLIKQVPWISIVPHFAIMGLFLAIFYTLKPDTYLFWGVGAYMLTSYLLRTQIPKSQRQGMILVKHQHFEGAIPLFEQSFDFFSKYQWIDDYRFIVILSSSRISYREIALVNIGFCYSQIGEHEKAKEYYNKTLSMFPDSQIALTALRMMDENFEDNTQDIK